MVKAGKFICKIVPLDAEVSRLKDGTLPTYWVHEKRKIWKIQIE